MKHTLTAVSLLLFLAGCAHHDDVRPSATNIHYISVNAQQREDGPREALKQAEHYCKSIKQKMFILNEEVSYEGTQPEEEYLNYLKTAKIVSGVGTMLWVFGDGKVDDVGGMAAIAGGTAESAMGKPYVTKMQFRCE